MSELRFTKEHEWARIEGNVATCGITDYAQKALGDIVYVELPAAGKKLKQNEQAAVVESAKAASEVYAPLDGDVTEVNSVLASDPAKVNAAANRRRLVFQIETCQSGAGGGSDGRSRLSGLCQRFVGCLNPAR